MSPKDRLPEHNKETFRNAGVVIAMVVTTFLILSVMGVIHFRTPDFEGIRESVTESQDPAVMTEADELALRKNYGLNVRDIQNFVYYAPKSSMDASEILVVETNSQAEAEALEARVEARRTTNEATFRNYRPEQAEILERSYLKTQGNFLIFISAENVNEIRDTVERAFR